MRYPLSTHQIIGAVVTGALVSTPDPSRQSHRRAERLGCGYSRLRSGGGRRHPQRLTQSRIRWGWLDLLPLHPSRILGRFMARLA